MRCGSISLTATRWRGALFAIRSPILPCYSRLFWSIITCSLIAGCDGAPQFKSTDITGAPYGHTLELADHHGKPRRLEDFRGKAGVLFFGFTHCPDICRPRPPSSRRRWRRRARAAGAEQGRWGAAAPDRATPEPQVRRGA